MNFNNSQSVNLLTNGFIREMETNTQIIYDDIIKIIERYVLLLCDIWDRKLSDEKFIIDTQLNTLQYKPSVDLSTPLDSFAFGMEVISYEKSCNFKHWKLCIQENTSIENRNSYQNSRVKTIIGILPNEMCQALKESNPSNFLGATDRTNGIGFYDNVIYFANHRNINSSNYFTSGMLKYGDIFEMIFDLREANVDNNQALLSFIVNGVLGKNITVDLKHDKNKDYRLVIALNMKTDIVQILQ